jgi:hypothetical protein
MAMPVSATASSTQSRPSATLRHQRQRLETAYGRDLRHASVDGEGHLNFNQCCFCAAEDCASGARARTEAIASIR